MFKQRYSRSCEQGLKLSLALISNGLRAGLNLPQALRFAIRFVEPPLRTEWDLVLREVERGTSMEEALLHLEERVGSTEVSFVIDSIIVLRQVGGNLIQHFETLIQLYRSRALAKEKLKTQMMSQWVQALILGLMPVGLFAAVSIVAPDWFAPLWSTSLGFAALGIVLLLEGLAFLWIRKISSIAF